MELWIPITIMAAFMQNARSALQKHLKASLTTSGATFSRFVFAAPLAFLYVIGLVGIAGYEPPTPNAAFMTFAVIGGLSQIGATALLVSIFSARNFAVGTTFAKTETVQAAIFGLVLLGDSITGGALFGIVVSLVGVILISMRPASGNGRSRMASLLDRSALVGIASGALFGVSAVSYRAASLGLADGDFVIRAAVTLAVVTAFQTLVMAVYMRLREPGQILAVMASWRVSGLVGLTGMLASTCWFTAMTLENAAHVRAVGQIELVFTFIASHVIFRERSSRREVVGIVLVTLGVLVLIFWHS